MLVIEECSTPVCEIRKLNRGARHAIWQSPLWPAAQNHETHSGEPKRDKNKNMF